MFMYIYLHLGLIFMVNIFMFHFAYLDAMGRVGPLLVIQRELWGL